MHVISGSCIISILMVVSYTYHSWQYVVDYDTNLHLINGQVGSV